MYCSAGLWLVNYIIDKQLNNSSSNVRNLSHRCPVTKLSGLPMRATTLSFRRQETESMCPGWKVELILRQLKSSRLFKLTVRKCRIWLIITCCQNATKQYLLAVKSADINNLKYLMNLDRKHYDPRPGWKPFTNYQTKLRVSIFLLA